MKKRDIIFSILLLCCLSVFVFSVWKLIEMKLVNNKANSIINETVTIIDKHQKPKEKLTVDKIHLPSISFQHMTKEAFQELKQQNNDFIGYLWFDSELLKDPIVQTTDNSYYLHVDFHDKYNMWGTTFMNYKNTLDDMNLTFYGHTSHSDKTMRWAPLYEFVGNNDFYKKHMHFNIYFENEMRRYRIVYVYNNGDFTFDHQVTNLTEAEFGPFLEFVKKKNTIDSFEDLEFGDKFVTLQSCKRGDNSQRSMIVAKEIGRFDYE